MNINHAIFCAVIAASFPATAFAGACNIDLTEPQQVAKIKMTVENKSSDKLRVKLLAFDMGTLVDLDKKKSKSRTINISKDQTPSSTTGVLSRKHGINIQVYDEYVSGKGQNIMTTSFNVTNDYSPNAPDTTKHASSFNTTRVQEQKKFNRYDVSCKVSFDGSGKNSWKYKITIKDK